MNDTKPERGELVEELRRAGDAASYGPVYRRVMVWLAAVTVGLVAVVVAGYFEWNHRLEAELESAQRAQEVRDELIMVTEDSNRLLDQVCQPDKDSTNDIPDGECQRQANSDRAVGELILHLLNDVRRIHGCDVLSSPEQIFQDEGPTCSVPAPRVVVVPATSTPQPSPSPSPSPNPFVTRPTPEGGSVFPVPRQSFAPASPAPSPSPDCRLRLLGRCAVR